MLDDGCEQGLGLDAGRLGKIIGAGGHRVRLWFRPSIQRLGGQQVVGHEQS
jgi:hypothetical protein